jgi:hypothetical protein
MATTTLAPTSQMTTTTLAPIQAHTANIASVAEDIIASVIESGTTSNVATMKDSQRAMAESSLWSNSSAPFVSDTSSTHSMSAAPIVLFSRVVPPSASASGPASPAVTGIPFSCPVAANSHVDQIVGQYRLDYLVLCNTAVTTADRVGKPINTEDAMSYAVRYSSINAAAGELILFCCIFYTLH